MKDTTIAVDIAKDVFEIAVSPEPGVVSETHRVSRKKLLSFFANRPAATVVMEACGSSHHWGREITKLGHRVVLLPPHVVRPYVQRNKSDQTDAKGMLEAYRNKDIKPVPVKSIEQQSVTALHRVRSAWVASRTACINMIRGLLRELGIFIPVGARKVVPTVLELVEDADSGLPDAIRNTLHEVCMEIRNYEKRIRDVEKQIEALSKQIPTVRLLRTIPGVGLLTSTALVAFIGDVQRFRSSRQFASFLGLTPRLRGSGFTLHLGSISKQGDRYLRSLLTHGARSVLIRAGAMEKPDRLRAWALKVYSRRGHNKATVAVANKLARTVWAVWKHNTEFQSYPKAFLRHHRHANQRTIPTTRLAMRTIVQMAHRSDRREGKPKNLGGIKARSNDWLLARGFHFGQEGKGPFAPNPLHSQAGDTSARLTYCCHRRRAHPEGWNKPRIRGPIFNA